MSRFADRIAQMPRAAEPERATGVLDALADPLRKGALGQLLHGAAGSSPYLARLITRHKAWLAEALSGTPEDILQDLLDTAATEIRAVSSVSDASRMLRQTKTRAALLIGLADLAGIWPLLRTTGALTDLADRLTETASGWLLEREVRSGKLPGLTHDDLAGGAGYVLLAMGKMGARELNYSSDIDLIALFDSDRFDDDSILDARSRYIAITRDLVKLLSENTADGYVFRVDLRLRPAPSTTPVCMAMEAAERYYESVGRTWERAAHIKARALGDHEAGARYLSALTPFIWRRYLDFAAIEDTQEMLRKIRAQKTPMGLDAVRGRDLKLGRGGIREIEFFVQTRQLIVGGRDASLRVPTTLGGLDALHSAGWITAEEQTSLAEDYIFLRQIEHRLQMIEDAQTHTVPKSDEAMARLAGLCGMDVAQLEHGLAACVERVHATSTDFFAAGETHGTTPGAVAVEPLRGFERPDDAARQLSRWQQGQIAATRGDRARALYAKLEPQIISRLGQATDPDQALVHFDKFLSGLPAGVQVFSLFSVNPALLDLIIEICTSAPRLAAYLGRHAQTLDALLDHTFWEPIPDDEALSADLAERLTGLDDYERTLDATRRWARELRFRIGLHILRGVADAPEAGLAFTRVAEVCIRSLLPSVIEDFSKRHGSPPGIGLSVLGMGKLGSAEMTDGSDLDLIVVYDGGDAETSAGPRPLAPQVYYPRLTQSLVAALTAPTAEGVLYEVDMRLRPSGRQGPVAVSLASFEKYQQHEAWVWEHMALTRARAVAGNAEISTRLESIAKTAIASRRASPEVLIEAAEMHGRLSEAHETRRRSPWSLKHAAGGLMDIEFLAQVGVLYTGLEEAHSVGEALPKLGDAGWLSSEEVAQLADAALLHQRLQQVERVALDTEIAPEALSNDLKQILARAARVDDFSRIAQRLEVFQNVAEKILQRKLMPAT